MLTLSPGTVVRFAPITTPPGQQPASPAREKGTLLPSRHILVKRGRGKLGIATRDVRLCTWSLPFALLAGCRDVEYSYDAWFEGRMNGAFTFVALRDLEIQICKLIRMVCCYASRCRRSTSSSPQPYGTRTMERLADIQLRQLVAPVTGKSVQDVVVLVARSLGSVISFLPRHI